MREVMIAPSILSADFSKLGAEIKKVEKDADFVHVDVMDGHFVPNITIGPGVVKAVRKATHLPLDVHLMIQNPLQYVEAFAGAGSDYITVHVESNHWMDALEKIGLEEKKCGVAINPATKTNFLLPVLHKLDMVTVMTVNPGFGAQKFMPEPLEKVRQLRKIIDKEGYITLIEVDGGVKLENAAKVIKAGADILVAGSAVYHSEDPVGVIQKLKAIKNGQ